MGRMNLLDAYKADLELRGHAQTTLVSEMCRIQNYLTWLGKDPAMVTREDLKAYLQNLRKDGQKSATIAKTFSTINVFHDWLEEEGLSSANPVRAIRKKYLQSYKLDSESRQIISIEQAAQIVASTIDTRDRALLLLLLKTGIRRGELASLDASDISLDGLSIALKPTAKRSNRIVFFDHETQAALRRWLKTRERRAGNESALFLTQIGQRLRERSIWMVIVKAAERVGLHTPGAPLEKRFGPHCCRHFFTTHLLRSGMSREHVKWLRGDVMREAIDIYNHISPDDVKRSYLAHIPQLGV